MARAAITNMKRFVELGKPWHNEEWNYLFPETHFDTYSEAIDHLEKYIEESDGGYCDRI